MFRRFSVNFAILSICFDALWITISLFISTIVRPVLNQYGFAQTVAVGYRTPWQVYPLFALIWLLVLLLFSVYDGRKNLKIVDEFSSLTLGSILAAVASAGLLYLTFRDISRLLFIVFVFLSYLGLIMWRALYRLSLRYGRRNADIRNVLVIGAEDVGQKVREHIQKSAEFGLQFTGYLDDESSDEAVIGYLAEARKVVSDQKVDDVVVALPRRAYQRVNRIVSELHDLPVRVWVIPDYFSLVMHQAVVEEYAGIPMLNLRAPALNEYQRLVKRAFDLVVCILLLPLVLPLIGGVFLLIHIMDGGKAIFIQERAGENGKLFRVYKFRTMAEGAEAVSITKFEDKEVVHKRPDDPRVTRIGRILRRTSLDELPNIFNVLKGDMSLVGPRPELPFLVDQYEEWQRKRFTMPPGITGWWQVTGRSDKPMHLNTEDDLYYIQHYSLWLDIVILWKTIWAVLKGKGAY